MQGAVYLVLSGLKYPTRGVAGFLHFVLFLNIALFFLNVITLSAQAIIYPKDSIRLIRNPDSGIFAPLIVHYLLSTVACKFNTAY